MARRKMTCLMSAASRRAAPVETVLHEHCDVILLAHRRRAGVAFGVMGEIGLIVRRADRLQPSAAELARGGTRAGYAFGQSCSGIGAGRLARFTAQQHQPILPRRSWAGSRARSAARCAGP